jgi:hypothetical protein
MHRILAHAHAHLPHLHLENLILREIEQHGQACLLNHTDVSRIENFSSLCSKSPFNSDISEWDNLLPSR